MKNLNRFFGIILFLAFTHFLSFADAKLYIKGMSCSSCVQSISKELKKFESVENVSISLETGELQITYKKESKNPLTEAQIKESLNVAGGYELSKTPANDLNTQKK